MIKTDRKIISAVLKCTNNYRDEITFDNSSSSLLVIDNDFKTVRSIPVSIPSDELPEAVQRLMKCGMLRTNRTWHGGYSFCMTSLLKHRRAFWWDAFAKKFWGGFVSGIITGIIVTVLGGLLLSYLRVRWGI